MIVTPVVLAVGFANQPSFINRTHWSDTCARFPKAPIKSGDTERQRHVTLFDRPQAPRSHQQPLHKGALAPCDATSSPRCTHTWLIVWMNQQNDGTNQEKDGTEKQKDAMNQQKDGSNQQKDGMNQQEDGMNQFKDGKLTWRPWVRSSIVETTLCLGH